MTVALYEIASMRNVLDEWLAETDGELTVELEALLTDLDGQADEKIERVGLYIQELVANAKAIRSEADRLFARAATKENAVASLKDYLKRNMEHLGKTKVQGLLATVRIQKNSQPSVTTPLEGIDLYAADETRPFVRREEIVKFSLDRDAILAQWKANQPLPAAIVVEQGNHVRVV